MSSFVHLHLHTEYSLIDSLIRIDGLVSKAAELSMPAIAVTDQSNLFSAIKFYQAAMAKGIKPILGAECWLKNNQYPSQFFRLILLCQDQQGYRNLIQLISLSYLEQQQEQRPFLQKSWLSTYSKGLIALSGGKEGDIGVCLLNNKLKWAKEYLENWLELFPDRFYLQLQRVGKPQEEDYISSVIDLAQKYNVPVVASNEVCFLYSSDFEAHEARVCINNGYTLNDPNRPRLYTEQQYLRSMEEMDELFADIPAAILNSVEIAKRCSLKINFNASFLPHFAIPEKMSPEVFLTKEAEKGLLNYLETKLTCFNNNTLGEGKSETKAADLGFPCVPEERMVFSRKLYFDRLYTELKVINSMGFASYFLIVADFIRWAKKNCIPVGPGRGSGAGSLVAYVLQITGLDPLRYGLLFERFLNPERISMPDFDIDFCMEGRDRVIEYVTERYGRDSVSQIITFGTMTARAVVRDVGRVLGYPYGMVDKVAKLIPFELGITLDKALEQENELQQCYENEEEIKGLIDLAKKLEGLVRNVGKHAGGVVIAPSKLTDFTPLYCEFGSPYCITQFDKDDIEKVGLVKFDFLGLRTLTIINWAVESINVKKNENEPLLDISNLPIDDSKTFDLLKACKTAAVFQLESRGMRDLVQRLQPDNFDEMVALVALFRPGPLQSGMVDDFINRKHGCSLVSYIHPLLEPILKSTYGIILYQEQVMQIAQVLAGYTLGAADLLRRAMGKKKLEEMAQQRAVFIKGAKRKGLEVQLASQIFDLMEKFADYGFNKSHSTAYALVSYQTAWLKAHYPAEFMAAVLSADMDNTEKIVSFLEECTSMQLKVSPPDVNQSYYRFTVDESTGELRYGLGAIKGLGVAAIDTLIEERQKRPFRDLFDLCYRVNTQKLNRRGLEALIFSGSLDSFGLKRSHLIENLPLALRASNQRSSLIGSGQQDFFGLDTFYKSPSAIEQSDLEKRELKLKYLRAEREVLGFYLSGHPLKDYVGELAHFTTCFNNLSSEKGQRVTIGGWVLSLRSLWTKRGDRMAVLILEDITGRLEVTLFSNTFSQYRDKLNKDKLLIVEGEVQCDEWTGNKRILGEKILEIAEARENYAKNLLISSSQPFTTVEQIESLRKILDSSPGLCPISIEYYHPELQEKIQFSLGHKFSIKPKDELLEALRRYLGEGSILMKY